MPVYEYSCPSCFTRFDRYEHAAGAHERATCGCGLVALRVWSPPQVSIPNVEPHFNYGLGQRVSSRRDIRDAQRRYAGETGSNLVEVGNDTGWRAARRHLDYPTSRELGVC